MTKSHNDRQNDKIKTLIHHFGNFNTLRVGNNDAELWFKEKIEE